jgi:HemY protein
VKWCPLPRQSPRVPPSLPAPPTPTAAEQPQAATAETPVPVFRPRIVPDSRARAAAAIPAVIPIVRAPDDPGVSDDVTENEFAERTDPLPAQAGGFKGFLSRWGRR